MVRRFDRYLLEHQNLIFPHRHSFYQFVLFTKGGGKHSIDFNQFDVTPFQIYFMVPGQVHSWDFEGEMDGYIVNFSESYFQAFLLKTDYLDSFSIFSGAVEDTIINLKDPLKLKLIELFEDLILQSQHQTIFRDDIIRVLLIQIFILIEQTKLLELETVRTNTSSSIVKTFHKLVEKNFVEKRLPGEYADLLNITPNHLNALTKEYLGKQAGEVIRERIILEAKRMLVSLDLTVAEIAYQLNFNDTSYFGKFFRKYEGKTPEAFRKRS